MGGNWGLGIHCWGSYCWGSYYWGSYCLTGDPTAGTISPCLQYGDAVDNQGCVCVGLHTLDHQDAGFHCIRGPSLQSRRIQEPGAMDRSQSVTPPCTSVPVPVSVCYVPTCFTRTTMYSISPMGVKTVS